MITKGVNQMIKKEDGFSNERYITYPIKKYLTDADHPLVNDVYPTEMGYYPNALYHYKERLTGVDECILLYCVDGQGHVEFDSKHFDLRKHDCLCIPAQTAHRYFADEENPWSIFWIHFSLPDFKLYPIMGNKIEIVTEERYSLVEKHFINLFSICEKEYSLENTIYISKLLQLILSEICFLKDYQETNQQNILLSKAIHYMNNNLSRPITLTDISDHLEISSSYLSSIFNKYYDQGPIEYLISLRIEQACRYLRISNMKNYEIAKKVGYEDAYYFSRLFKSRTGLSPKAYKHSIFN